METAFGGIQEGGADRSCSIFSIEVASLYKDLVAQGISLEFAETITLEYVRNRMASSKPNRDLGRLLGDVSQLSVQLGIEKSRLKAARSELSPEGAAIVATLKDVIRE